MSKKDNEDAVITALAIPTVIALVFIIAIPFALFNAWVALTLYNWFALPLGAPALNIWHAWGIMMLISRFTFKLDTKSEDDGAKAWGKIAMYILGSLVVLLIGLIIKNWI